MIVIYTFNLLIFYQIAILKMSMLNSRKNTEIDKCVPYLSNLSKYAESARDEIRENNFLKEKINQIKEIIKVIVNQ